MNLPPISNPTAGLVPARPARVNERGADFPTVPAQAAAAPEPGSLWDVLTPAEREFFTRIEAMGPLSYRPAGRESGAPAAPTGQRIDVRG